MRSYVQWFAGFFISACGCIDRHGIADTHVDEYIYPYGESLIGTVECERVTAVGCVCCHALSSVGCRNAAVIAQFPVGVVRLLPTCTSTFREGSCKLSMGLVVVMPMMQCQRF